MSQATLQVHYKLDQNSSGASSTGGAQLPFKSLQNQGQGPAHSFKFENSESLKNMEVQPKIILGVKRNRNQAVIIPEFISLHQ